MKVGASPGRTLEARKPIRTNSSNITTDQISRLSGFLERIERIMPNCAEQGIARASRIFAISLSRFVSRVRVTIVAIVEQPNPSTIGITALPLSPIFLNMLSRSRPSLGRYPVSSIIENTRKKAPTIGSIRAIAYVTAWVKIPYSPTKRS